MRTLRAQSEIAGQRPAANLGGTAEQNAFVPMGMKVFLFSADCDEATLCD